MEIKYQCPGSKRGGRFFSIIFFLSLFLLSGSHPLKAQESDSLKDSASASTAATDGGPSLSNLSKTAAALDDRVNKIKEEERRSEILSYVYMGVGFSIVIAIAWFTTSLARKRQKKADDEKAIRLANMKHKPHHHRR
ncbi:MAG: hypothetical protein ACJ77K_13625 [Bacteroidia bacterium]